MAFTIPNYNDATYRSQASLDSVDIDIIVDGIRGNGVVSGLNLTSITDGDTLNIAAGKIVYDYNAYNISAYAVDIPDADIDHPLLFLVYANTSGDIESISGIANGNLPEIPLLPSDSVSLYTVHKEAGSNDITVVDNIIDKRVFVSDVPISSTTTKGIIEVSTNEETQVGTVTNKSVPPSALSYLFGGKIAFIPGTNPPRIFTEGDYFININSPLVLFRNTEEFDLHTDNDSPRGIYATAQRTYVLDSEDSHIYVYDSQGNRKHEEEVGLSISTTTSGFTGIAVSIKNNRVYITDNIDNKIYVFNLSSGNRISGEDFNLPFNNLSPIGIGLDDEEKHLYVADSVDSRVYVYTLVGNRVSGKEFNMHSANSNSTGISVSGNRVYISDNGDDRFYVYNLSGVRQNNEELSVLNDGAANVTGLATTTDRIYLLDNIDTYVYVYDLDGNRKNFTEFNLSSANGNPQGISSTGNKIYIVDRLGARVYVYQLDGTYIASESFNLDSGNTASVGISVANDRIYIVDITADRIFTYQLDGTYVASESFNLDSSNPIPSGLSVTINRAYVVDSGSDKLFTYELDGTHLSDESFDLNSNNRNSGGVSVTSDRVYVVNGITSNYRIYIYKFDGTRVIEEEFNLYSYNTSTPGISVDDKRVYVVDSTDSKVYVYDIIHGSNKIWKRMGSNWDEIDHIDFKILRVEE